MLPSTYPRAGNDKHIPIIVGERLKTFTATYGPPIKKIPKIEKLRANVEVGNQKDNFGNSLFGGVSGTDKPFEVGSNGHVKYNGSSLAKEIQVTSGLAVKQNFSGIDVFDNVKSSEGAFSIFSIADDLIDSLQIELNSGTSANLFSKSSTAILRLPNSGPEADVSFKLLIDGKTVSLNEKVN